MTSRPTILDQLLEKISATRYEKEIAKGNITRRQVSSEARQAAPAPGSGLETSDKRRVRSDLARHSDRDQKAVDLRRGINQKVYHTQMDHPEVAGAGNVVGFKRFMPRVGPATLQLPGKRAVVGVPEESGQFLRAISGDVSGASKGIAKTYEATKLLKTPEEKAALLPKREAHDSTLNRAIMAHEFGEASIGNKRPGTVYQPASRHAGVRAIVEENLASVGDPKASTQLHNLRRYGTSGDSLIHKAIRSVGGTPDSPIPKGGRQEAAVNRIVARNAKRIDAPSRKQAVGTMFLEHLRHPDRPREKLEKNVPYVPSHVHEAVQGAAKNIRNVPKPFLGLGPIKDALTGNINRLKARHRLAGMKMDKANRLMERAKKFADTGE